MTDAQQFEVFMRNYQNMVFSTAMRLLANEADAQDVSQEVFLRAYSHFGQLRDNPAAGGWLRTVATNLSLNHLTRYRSRWSFFSDLFGAPSDDGIELAEVNFLTDESGGEVLADSERREVVERALRTLPANLRVPLVLFHLEGLRYEEIAARLGISMGKVKTDIFRARAALRDTLRNAAGEGMH